MGHIKEPKGIDFIVQSKPLTDDERAGISEYIRNYKAKSKAKHSPRWKQQKPKKDLV